jgi:hypothetical protein
MGPAIFISPEAYTEIPLAILEHPPRRRECHVFVDSKAATFEITDKLPQYVEYGPE